MNKHRKAFLLLANQGGGYNWHVDSVSGSDDNAGTESAPFASLTKLMTVWVAGESVGLAKGSTWAEQLDIPGSGVSVNAYGTGVMPKITALDTLSTDGWAKTDGYTNIYGRTLSGMTTGAASAVGLNVYEDGAQHTYYTSLANLDGAATVPGYFVADPGTATPTLYINASGAEKDPAANGKVYKYNKRNACIQEPNDAYINWSVDGIECEGGYQTGGVIRMGQGCTVSNCKITAGNKYSVFVRDGCTITGTTIINGHHPTESAIYQLLYNQDTPAGLGITISGCTFGWSSATAPRISVCNVITGHYNTSGSFGAMVISGCTATNGARFQGALNAVASVLITDCTVTNFQYGFAPGGTGSSGSWTVRDCTWASNVANQRLAEQGSTTIPISLENISAVATGSISAGWVYITAAGVVSITDSDLTIANGGNIRLVNSTAATAGFTSLRNTYARDNIAAFYTLPADSVWSSDNNVFDVPGPATNFRMEIYGTTYSTLATYQAAVAPNDANSTVT